MDCSRGKLEFNYDFEILRYIVDSIKIWVNELSTREKCSYSLTDFCHNVLTELFLHLNS